MYITILCTAYAVKFFTFGTYKFSEESTVNRGSTVCKIVKFKDVLNSL